MTKTKKRSRFFAVALVAVLMLALAVPSFAEPGKKVVSSDLETLDTAHGHYFHSGNYWLNQWGNAPVSGTSVTTWSKSDDDTQAWDVCYTINGRWIITTNMRRDLALNIYRSGGQPEVNVIPYLGNDYNDCVLTRDTLKLAFQPAPYANYGVTITSTPAAGSNGDIYARVCRWTSASTMWTHEA